MTELRIPKGTNAMKAISASKNPKHPVVLSVEKIYTFPYVSIFAISPFIKKRWIFMNRIRQQIGSCFTFFAFIKK